MLWSARGVSYSLRRLGRSWSRTARPRGEGGGVDVGVPAADSSSSPSDAKFFRAGFLVPQPCLSITNLEVRLFVCADQIRPHVGADQSACCADHQGAQGSQRRFVRQAVDVHSGTVVAPKRLAIDKNASVAVAPDVTERHRFNGFVVGRVMVPHPCSSLPFGR
jgi:hypothetical protein